MLHCQDTFVKGIIDRTIPGHHCLESVNLHHISKVFNVVGSFGILCDIIIILDCCSECITAAAGSVQFVPLHNLLVKIFRFFLNSETCETRYITILEQLDQP